MSESLTDLLATDAELDMIAARQGGSHDHVLAELALLAAAVDETPLPPVIRTGCRPAMSSTRKGGWALSITVALMVTSSGVAAAVSENPLAPLHYMTTQMWKMSPHDGGKVPGWDINGSMPISTVPAVRIPGASAPRRLPARRRAAARVTTARALDRPVPGARTRALSSGTARRTRKGPGTAGDRVIRRVALEADRTTTRRTSGKRRGREQAARPAQAIRACPASRSDPAMGTAPAGGNRPMPAPGRCPGLEQEVARQAVSKGRLRVASTFRRSREPPGGLRGRACVPAGPTRRNLASRAPRNGRRASSRRRPRSRRRRPSLRQPRW